MMMSDKVDGEGSPENKAPTTKASSNELYLERRKLPLPDYFKKHNLLDDQLLNSQLIQRQMG